MKRWKLLVSRSKFTKTFNKAVDCEHLVRDGEDEGPEDACEHSRKFKRVRDFPVAEKLDQDEEHAARTGEEGVNWTQRAYCWSLYNEDTSKCIQDAADSPYY